MSRKLQKTQPVATWENITPKLATSILTKVHPRQAGRNSEVVVTSYADQMDRKLWDENVAQTISIDTDGNLTDGWHRLNAVVKSGKTHRFLVVRGVSPEAFGKYDSGSARSAAFRNGLDGTHMAVINGIVRLCAYPASPGKILNEQVAVTKEFIADEWQYYQDNAVKLNRPRLSAAPIRTVLVLSMKRFPDRREDILNAYNHLVHMDLSGAPRSMSSLNRRLMESLHPVSMQWALAWAAFNPAKFDADKIQIGDPANSLAQIKVKLLDDLFAALF